MTLPKEEADTLRRCLAILAPLHERHECRTMALNIEQRIKGESTSLLCLRYTQFAALFYPGNQEKALGVAEQMQAAADAGELATIIPPNEKGATISDLAAWPDCPPIPAESPLRYWLPHMPTPAQNTASASVIVHSTKARRDTLTPVIELAQKQCHNAQDTAEVWAFLLVLAEKKHPPLIGATEDGLQYLNKGSADIFKRKSLSKRLAR